MSIRFKIPGPSVGKERVRVGQHRAVTPDKTKDYEKHVRSCCQAEMLKPCYKDYRKMLPSADWWVVELGLWHGSDVYPDADNIFKSILDALQGTIWKNDKRVIPRVTCVFTYCKNPGVYVEIRKALDSEAGSLRTIER